MGLRSGYGNSGEANRTKTLKNGIADLRADHNYTLTMRSYIPIILAIIAVNDVSRQYRV